MFGYVSRKKLKKNQSNFNKEKSEFAKQKSDWESGAPERENEYVRRHSEESKKARDQARAEGEQYANRVLSRNVEGLTPQQRASMQAEASKQIRRQSQGAHKRLLGEQNRHGVQGKSGVAYAQQRDLHRLENEAKGQSRADIENLNSDLALKKLAASFNIEQGEAGQNTLDRQAARDELRMAEERNKQKKYEKKYNKIFSKV